MSEVISFKVSKELKEKYEKLKDVIDWPAELRAFVEERIQRLRGRLSYVGYWRRGLEKFFQGVLLWRL